MKSLLLMTSPLVFALSLLAGIVAASLRAQAPNAATAPSTTTDKPKFDAASIKPSKSSNQGTFLLGGSPGGLYREAHSTVRVLIASAYLNGFPPQTQLVLGGPNWIDSEHFDIEARAEGSPTREQKLVMLQSLLEDRFKLALHHETRQFPIYALVLSKPGKTGLQLTPHASEAKCIDPSTAPPPPPPAAGQTMPSFCGGFLMSARAGDLRETGNGVTLDALGKQIIQFLDRTTVVDRTGLTGLFDFSLEFAPQVGPASRLGPVGQDAGASDSSSAPTIFVALQEQLGLKLESTKGPVDVLVIDHIEQPTPN